MASSSLSRTWTYRVFASFHGQDVRKTFLTHLRKQFGYNGITMFDDQKIERGQTISPALTQAIRESRISIVLLSRNYASSSWCLDELVEILKCKEDIGQLVLTVFYGVDPSDVADQTGDFGIAFNKMCVGKTEKERRRWSQALNAAANIAGFDFQNWDNEAKMIEKISKDVSDKLNATPSWDFGGMVGLKSHLREMMSLLNLNDDGVRMVAIFGPAGIGKSTIARALHSLLAERFQRTCFVDNLRGSYPIGLDEYGLKLRLQEQLLSDMLNQNGIRISNLGVIKERLHDQKVLIILDDVNNIKQLEALAGDISWFGPGSRIVVTTENQELLQQHGINNTYHVGFPTREEALKILCRYAFSDTSPRQGFEELAERVAELCGNLPLGLRVVGSSLRMKNEDGWKAIIRSLETCLGYQDIEEVLRVGYESLHENVQSLFLHIAVFFNYTDGDLVKTMLAENDMDIKHGLEILVNKSLIYISTEGLIVMHKLLQQLGIKAVRREEPWKSRILIDAQEICDVLERAKGTRAVSGISLDVSDIDGLSINKKAFERMHNLRFLRLYRSKEDGNYRVHIPEDMEFPRRLRLLHWQSYPSKCLPPTFHPEYLVEFIMEDNKFEKLWEGTQLLTNLKKMNLVGSSNLKELPDLSNAINLQWLDLTACESLVEFPFSFGNLHKLEWLNMCFCLKLQVVPTHFNLASLENVNMMGCPQLRKFPVISTNITDCMITDTMLEELPESIRHWSRLESLTIIGSVNTLPHMAEKFIRRRGPDLEIISDDIQYLSGLKFLYIGGCPKLASLPELPSSLVSLIVHTCESLETVSFPFDSTIASLCFPNCFRLGEEAQRVITQESLDACLPGTEIPTVFDHRAIGNSLTIRSDFNRFRICLLVSPNQQIQDIAVLCHIRVNGCPIDENSDEDMLPLPPFRMKHLRICFFELPNKDGWLEQDKEILFEFSTTSEEVSIVACGVQILTDKTGRSRKESYESGSQPREAEELSLQFV